MRAGNDVHGSGKRAHAELVLHGIDALVSFDCRLVKKIAHGSHTILLGQVEQVLFGKKGKPLLYADGQYGKLAVLSHGEPLPEGLDYWGF